jgi:hypothetical protein
MAVSYRSRLLSSPPSIRVWRSPRWWEATAASSCALIRGLGLACGGFLGIALGWHGSLVIPCCLHQGPGVPKFGSWEDEGDHPYTQYFENARKGKSPGRSATQNEHRTGDPEALFKEDTTPSAKASPLRTGSEDPVAPKPKDAAFARGKPYAEPATHKHGANTSYERKTGMERSPLHPHHQARLVNRGGVSSPSWERRGSSEGNRGAAPTTPGRSSKMRPGGRGDETVMLAAALIRLRSYSILFSWITPAVTAG